MLSSLRSYHTDKLTQPVFWLTLFFLTLSPQYLKAQNTEIGMELGGYSYLGDVARSYQFSNNSLGGQFFIRKHIDDGLSIRFSVGAGQLEGADDEAFDVFSANRRASFQGDFVNTDMLFEYHFLDYRNPKLDQYWTPYILFGIGAYRFEGQDQLSNVYSSGLKLRIPVGVGIKVKLDRRWTLGMSASVIKTNSDVLDNVSLSTPNIKDYRGGNPNDDDVMFFTGFSLSYTFFRIVCPKPFF
ncbi:hypothetical protein BFP97_13850 [Roseivirga sp. 4D4]|uniref:type IX secretion system protein PorG n=1 Tax=Roseivirga sp. 4D4 TaxID=1889784 RepID=UPI000852BF23|nr:DUF6089 family protein [Roseivirga sp. 4D4]OEK02539.1 hypothetical protein BFP97_13850 [Roseivirga sp. 4D4]